MQVNQDLPLALPRSGRIGVARPVRNSASEVRFRPDDNNLHHTFTKPVPALSDQDLNHLFADAWVNFEPRPFGNILSRSLCYVACWDGGELVGFVNVAWDGDKHAFILDTTVRRSHQRAGIGGELVRRATDIARDRRARWLHLDFEPHLVDLYRQCGFHQTAAGLLKLR